MFRPLTSLCLPLQLAETRRRVLWTCILPLSMERKGVLPRRQSLLPLLSVVSSSFYRNHYCWNMMSAVPTWSLSFNFPPVLQWGSIHFVNKLALPSPINHQQYLSDLRQISNKVANFSDSDLALKASSPEIIRAAKSGHLISIILCYHRTEKGLENRAGPCMTLWFPQLQTVQSWWKETLSQWSQSFSHPSISSSSHSRGRRCRWQPNGGDEQGFSLWQFSGHFSACCKPEALDKRRPLEMKKMSSH